MCVNKLSACVLTGSYRTLRFIETLNGNDSHYHDTNNRYMCNLTSWINTLSLTLETMCDLPSKAWESFEDKFQISVRISYMLGAHPLYVPCRFHMTSARLWTLVMGRWCYPHFVHKCSGEKRKAFRDLVSPGAYKHESENGQLVRRKEFHQTSISLVSIGGFLARMRPSSCERSFVRVELFVIVRKKAFPQMQGKPVDRDYYGACKTWNEV